MGCKCWIGNDSNSVYSFLVDLRVHFDKSSFTQKSGLALSDIKEEDLAISIFYNKYLEIAEKEFSPKINDD